LICRIAAYADDVTRKVPNSRGIVGACYFIPNIVSGIMMVSLPWTSKGGLLAAVYLGGLGTPGFVLSLSWCAATNLGHTKKTTANAMLLIGYCGCFRSDMVVGR
jgi:hypothetical protein